MTEKSKAYQLGYDIGYRIAFVGLFAIEEDELMEKATEILQKEGLDMDEFNKALAIGLLAGKDAETRD